MASASQLNIDDVWRRLECPVCHDHYRKSKILPCGHTVCLSPCLEQIQNGKPRINCPECRMEHVVPDTGIKGFPSNIAISRVTEDATDKKDETFKGCPICGEDDHLVKCSHCNLLICEECKVQHTPKFRKQLLGLFESYKEEISSAITDFSNSELELSEQVKAEADLVRGEIDAVSKKLHSAVERRVQKMKDSVDAFENTERHILREQHTGIEANLHQSSRFCESVLDELKSESRLSHAKLAKIHAKYHEHCTKTSQSKMIIHKPKKVCNLNLDVALVEEAIRTIDTNAIAEMDSREKTYSSSDASGSLNAYKKPTRSIEKLSSPVQAKMCFGSSIFSSPRGIAFEPYGHDIFVVDSGNNRICVFDKDGAFKHSFGSGGDGDRQFNNPMCIVVSKRGNLFISDFHNNRIQVFDTSGTFVRKFGCCGSKSGMFQNPWGIALDPAGNIHVCDSGNKRIQVFDEEGHFMYEYNTWKDVIDRTVRYISISVSGVIAIKFGREMIVLDQSKQLLNHFKHSGMFDVLSGMQFLDDNHLLMCHYFHDILRVYNVNGDTLKDIKVNLQTDRRKKLGATCVAIHGDNIYISSNANNAVIKI